MLSRFLRFVGEWMLRIGIRWTGRGVYTIPMRPSDISTMDFTKCECGHSMHDHLPDPDGHGTICLCCYATMRHRPVHARPPSADVADAVEVAKPYFAYDFDNNAEFFATEDEARKFAEAALEGAQECAGDTGWPENTTDICYGRIIGTVTLTRQLERPAAHLLDEDGCDPEGNCWQPEWSRMLWHELQPVATAERPVAGRMEIRRRNMFITNHERSKASHEPS